MCTIVLSKVHRSVSPIKNLNSEKASAFKSSPVEALMKTSRQWHLENSKRLGSLAVGTESLCWASAGHGHDYVRNGIIEGCEVRSSSRGDFDHSTLLNNSSLLAKVLR